MDLYIRVRAAVRGVGEGKRGDINTPDVEFTLGDYPDYFLGYMALPNMYCTIGFIEKAF